MIIDQRTVSAGSDIVDYSTYGSGLYLLKIFDQGRNIEVQKIEIVK